MHPDLQNSMIMEELKENMDGNNERTKKVKSVEIASDENNTEFSNEENHDANTNNNGTIIDENDTNHNSSSRVKRSWLVWVKSRIDSRIVTSLIITLIATIVGGLAVWLIPNRIVYYRCYTTPYITLEADYTQVFHISKKVDSLEYSVGESKWKDLKTQTIVFGGNRGKLLLRGKNRKGTQSARISFSSNAEVFCTGDICTLLNYEDYKNVPTDKARFDSLFAFCKQLVVAPELTPTILDSFCYVAMFYNCTSLKSAPELPADSLTKYCYSNMFKGCISLEQTPELKATKLAKGCYSGMFTGCTSLVTVSDLKVTDMDDYCYYEMFSGCTSLESGPKKMFARIPKPYCCSNMFKDCIALKKAPKLPATRLSNSCYSGMFSGCTSLIEAPDLPADHLADNCYSDMFYGCTSLKKAPHLEAEALAFGCYERMFSGCISLDEVYMLSTMTNVGDYCKDWFDNASPKGTFYKNESATWNKDDVVPSKWKVVLTTKKKTKTPNFN